MAGYWWCPACENEIDSCRVTYDERHDYHCNSPVVWVKTNAAAEPADIRPTGSSFAGARPSPCGECDRLSAENERLLQDAKRYRWLRENVVHCELVGWKTTGSLNAMDETIDAALAAKGE